MKPEIEMIELEVIDVIRTSVTEQEPPAGSGGPTQGKDETPWG